MHVARRLRNSYSNLTNDATSNSARAQSETSPNQPPTDRLQCQEGIEGIFGRGFCPSGGARQATCEVMPHGPTALVLAQEAEQEYPHPTRVFRLVPAPQAHPILSRPRGGRTSIGARSASFLRFIARSSWP
jgi:hypothetical protein